MQQAGVLVPVTQSTPWISSYVNVKSEDTKGGKKFCICLDLTNLNKVILHEPFFICTPNDVYTKLSKAKMLAVIDFKKGFWQVESSYLMTFHTPFGYFRFTDLPFGLTVSGDVFQHKPDATYGDLPLTIGCADNMIVWGEKDDPSDHDEALDKFLQVTWENGLCLGFDKIQYKKDEISFYGDTYTVNGHKPAEEKKKAIAEMSRPTNVKKLQSFLGVCNFLSKYSPRLTEPLNDLPQLICKGIPYNWGLEHMETFSALKEELTSALVLWYYVPKKPPVLQMDASSKGLGIVLLQESQPVYFTSKALSPCQWSYVASKLEALAVGWAVEKFHHFLYGWHFILEMDQKPLKAILSKHLLKASPQMQWLLMKTVP